MRCDVLIIGGGVGGVAAALAACRRGRTVIMTEPTDWIGGQFTQQAVPPDEHDLIEYYGRTASYQKFRTEVRNFYRQHYPLTETVRYSKPFAQYLNPGNAGVSRLCHEPSVGLAVLQQMLAPYQASGQLSLLLKYGPFSASVHADRITSVLIRSLAGEREYEVVAKFYLDASETGELLPLTGTEYVTGSESVTDTGEPHASPERRPLNMQAVTSCFALGYHPEEDHTIDKPKTYEFWRNYQPRFWPTSFLSWTFVNPITLDLYKFPLFGARNQRSLWLYRRIIDQTNFEQGTFRSDITLVNWPQNDYFLGPVFEIAQAEAANHAEAAKQLSLSLLYWMQTEAPRHDGGTGYPGLKLRPDMVGTQDGLAKHLYIRESRRIVAERTVVEQDLSKEVRSGQILAEPYPDSIGVGHYRIDLHPTTEGDNYLDLETLPFRIPLGSLIPARMENLLAAGKNIGTTHITNGCYRLHPTEWNVGEAAGALAAYCLERGISPRAVRNVARELAEFQSGLTSDGFDLAWNESDWA